jgi:hypothetical protein
MGAAYFFSTPDGFQKPVRCRKKDTADSRRDVDENLKTFAPSNSNKIRNPFSFKSERVSGIYVQCFLNLNSKIVNLLPIIIGT